MGRYKFYQCVEDGSIKQWKFEAEAECPGGRYREVWLNLPGVEHKMDAFEIVKRARFMPSPV